MNIKNRKKLNFLLGLIGTGALIPGLLEILYGLTGGTYTWLVLKFGGDFTIWRGLILLAAGTIFLFAINQPNPVQKRAQAILASSMIWIVGGIEILSIVLDSITGGETWFNTVKGFTSYYTGPFAPSVLLLPISLLLFKFVNSDGENND